MRGSGIERTGRPRAPDCDGAAEGSDLRDDGESEVVREDWVEEKLKTLFTF